MLYSSEASKIRVSKPSIFKTFGYMTASSSHGSILFFLQLPKNLMLDHPFRFFPMSLVLSSWEDIQEQRSTSQPENSPKEVVRALDQLSSLFYTKTLGFSA